MTASLASKPLGRAVALVRVSTDKQDHERQVLAVKRWSDAEGLPLAIVEETRSGGAKKRPKLDEIMEAARRHEVSILVVSETSRLARSVQTLSAVMNELAELKVRVVILSLGWDLDVTTSHGRFLVSVMGAVAELQKDIIRENTKEALNGGKKDGKRISIYGAKLGAPALQWTPELDAELLRLFETMTAAQIVASGLVRVKVMRKGKLVEVTPKVGALWKRVRGLRASTPATVA